jgi:hypothetical protein
MNRIILGDRIMSKNVVRFLGALALFVPVSAFASSHREAPAISNDPAADNTDLWAWTTDTTHDTVHIVANWIPLEEPSGGPNFHAFSDDVLYQIHVGRGDSLAPAVTYEIKFTTSIPAYVAPATLVNPDAGVGGGKEFFAQLSGRTQTYSVTKVVAGVRTVILAAGDVAPPNIGPRTDAVIRAAVPYDDAFAAGFVEAMTTGEGAAWAGPRDDAFYVDLGGIFDLANLRGAGVAQDGVSGFNVHSIALDIPTGKLTADGQIPAAPTVNSVINVWASSSRRKVTVLKNNGERDASGPWVQVSRIGLPLINEAVIGLQDKDKYNATQPAGDVANFGPYFLNPVVVNDAIAVGIYGTPAATVGAAAAAPYRSGRSDILAIISLNDGTHTFTQIGDVLRVDLSADSGFPNGRVIYGGTNVEDDVTDTLLSVLLFGGSAPVGDNVDFNDKTFLTSIPYQALPWRGYDEGHGEPAADAGP